MQNFNTNKVFWWRLILEEYDEDIKYIKIQKNIAADELSQLPNNGNQKTTHESTYSTDTMQKHQDIKLSESPFPLSFKLKTAISGKIPPQWKNLKAQK